MLENIQPSIVVLVCGKNDLASGRAPRKTYKIFKKITRKIIRAGASVVYLGTKPEPRNTKLHYRYKAYDVEVKRLVSHTAEGSGGVTMIEVYEIFEKRTNPQELYEEDDLTLSALGYELWSKWTLKALEDPTCAVWRDSQCELKQGGAPPLPSLATSRSTTHTPPSRRATMVIGSSEGTANA